jgi:hypothetical protein
VPRNNGCDWFGRGELARLAFDALRDAPKPLSAIDIARTVVARKGMEPGDVAALRRVKNMVDATSGGARARWSSGSCTGRAAWGGGSLARTHVARLYRILKAVPRLVLPFSVLEAGGVSLRLSPLFHPIA